MFREPHLSEMQFYQPDIRLLLWPLWVSPDGKLRLNLLVEPV